MLVSLDHLPQASGVYYHIQRKQPTHDVAGFLLKHPTVGIIFLRPIPWTFQNATVESNAAKGAAASVRTNSKVMANFLKNN